MINTFRPGWSEEEKKARKAMTARLLFAMEQVWGQDKLMRPVDMKTIYALRELYVRNGGHLSKEEK